LPGGFATTAEVPILGGRSHLPHNRPRMSNEPRAQLDDARRLLDGGDPEAALPILEPLSRDPDPDVSSEAWQLIGTARYRADDEPGAQIAWQEAANAGGAAAWLGWRSVA
jgi:predicted Zn-dependent protease